MDTQLHWLKTRYLLITKTKITNLFKEIGMVPQACGWYQSAMRFRIRNNKRINLVAMYHHFPNPRQHYPPHHRLHQHNNPRPTVSTTLQECATLSNTFTKRASVRLRALGSKRYKLDILLRGRAWLPTQSWNFSLKNRQQSKGTSNKYGKMWEAQAQIKSKTNAIKL